MSLRRPFRPWRRDQALASACLVVALVALWGGMADGRPDALLAAGAAALLLAWIAWRAWQRAGARRFGVALERAAITRLAPLLDGQGLRWRANVRVHGLGDVDLLVHAAAGPVVVEVKSFRRWRQVLVFAGARERAAMAQARRARKALKASRALVWLPQGRPSWIHRYFRPGRRGVRVVFGPGRALLEALGAGQYHRPVHPGRRHAL